MMRTSMLVAVLLLVTTGACQAGAGPPPGASRTVVGTPTTAPSPRPSAGDLSARADVLRLAAGATGALVLVVDGDDRWFATAGTGDVDGTNQLDATSRFRIASITKPIVAALVLTAVDRGELRLDDVVGERLRGVLRDEPPVTVRQLLDHSSGIFDEGNEGDALSDIAVIRDRTLRREAQELLDRYIAGERVVAPDRVLVAMAETHPRYFEPGTGYHYSNTNYELAAMVLEAVTGDPVADLLEARITTPLGLGRTSIAPPDLSSPELRGYQDRGGEPVDVTDDLLAYGNGGHGGILTTPDELLAILQAIVRAELFPQALVDEMATPARSNYGLGLATYELGCGTFLGHAGSISGTDSIALVSPDGVRGAVLAVNHHGGPDAHLQAVAESLLCRAR